MLLDKGNEISFIFPCPCLELGIVDIEEPVVYVENSISALMALTIYPERASGRVLLVLCCVYFERTADPRPSELIPKFIQPLMIL